MNDLKAQRLSATQASVSEISSGMLIGLGTGRTATYAIEELGRRIREDDLRVKVVATSLSSEALAKSVGIDVLPLKDMSAVDLTIDGADELDGTLRAIKGGGGALLREKIVASASARMLVIVDSAKLVKQLGQFKVPLEVFPFAAVWVESSIRKMGAHTRTRSLSDGTPFLTDQGNLILDADFGLIGDPASLSAELNAIPGIVEHGLFLTEIDIAYVGGDAEVENIVKPSSGQPMDD